MTAVSREHSQPRNTGPAIPGPRGRVPVPEAQAHAAGRGPGADPHRRARARRTAECGVGGHWHAGRHGAASGRGVMGWCRGVDGSCVPVTVRQVAPTVRHERRRFVPLPHEPSPDVPNRRPERTNRRWMCRTVDPSVRTVRRRRELSRKHPNRHARSAAVRRDPPRFTVNYPIPAHRTRRSTHKPPPRHPTHHTHKHEEPETLGLDCDAPPASVAVRHSCRLRRAERRSLVGRAGRTPHRDRRTPAYTWAGLSGAPPGARGAAHP